MVTRGTNYLIIFWSCSLNGRRSARPLAVPSSFIDSFKVPFRRSSLSTKISCVDIPSTVSGSESNVTTLLALTSARMDETSKEEVGVG